MPSSQNYKLAKVSAPRRERQLFDRQTDDAPGEIIAKVILGNPFVPSQTSARGDEGGKRWAIFNAKDFGSGIIEGDFAREGSVEWPHVEGQKLEQDILSANPFCHFFYDRHAQIAAFQSARMNQSLRRMLEGWDSVLKPHLDTFGRFPHSQPLFDEEQFMAALRGAQRIFSITFDMIPPNGYTNDDVEELLGWVSEATAARDVQIKIDGGKGGNINPEARSVRELSAECAAGNGNARAPIVDADGQFRTVSTAEVPILRQLAGRSVTEVKRLLRWASAKVGE